MSGMYAQTGGGRRPDEFTIRVRAEQSGSIGVYGPGVLDAWLHRIGPTPIVVWQYLARLVLNPPDPDSAPVVIVADLASWSGVSVENAWRAIDRLVQFGRLQWISGDVLGVEVSTHAVPRREGGPVPSRPRAVRS